MTFSRVHRQLEQSALSIGKTKTEVKTPDNSLLTVMVSLPAASTWLTEVYTLHLFHTRRDATRYILTPLTLESQCFCHFFLISCKRIEARLQQPLEHCADFSLGLIFTPHSVLAFQVALNIDLTFRQQKPRVAAAKSGVPPLDHRCR